MESTELFGGYMKICLPNDTVDISDVRQIPDHQEVFAHSVTDQSIIIEILEHVAGIDEQAVKTHYEDLANSNDAEAADNNTIVSIKEMACNEIAMHQADALYLLHGQQKVAKFNESTRNTLDIYLAVFRLQEYSTDIVVSFNNPINISPESSSHKAIPVSCQPWTVDDFERCIKSLAVVNTDLFAAEQNMD